MPTRRMIAWLTTLLTASANLSLAWAGEHPVVDERATNTGSSVSAKDIQNLPLQGRSFADLASLVPGVVDHKALPNDSVDWSQYGVLDGQHGKVPVQQRWGDYANVLSDPAWSRLSRSREWPGERYGINGSLIATGTSRGNEKTAVLYDGFTGAPYSSFTARELKSNPAVGLNALNYGCHLTSGKMTLSDKMMVDAKESISGKQRMFNDMPRNDYPRYNTTDKHLVRFDYPGSQTRDNNATPPVRYGDGLKDWNLRPNLSLDYKRLGGGGMTPIDAPAQPNGPQNTGSAADQPTRSIIDDLNDNTAPMHDPPTGEPTIKDNPDGSSTRTWADGTTETTRPNGTQDITFPDGSKFSRGADGSVVDTKPDGSTTTRDRTGKVTGTTIATVTDQTIIDQTAKQKPAIRDAINQYLTPGGQAQGGGTSTPQTGTTPGTQPKNTNTPPTTNQNTTPTGSTPSTGQPTTPTGAKDKSTVTDQDIIKGVSKQKGAVKDAINQYLTPQGQKAVKDEPAKPPAQDQKNPSSSLTNKTDFGADLGGPIVKDKLWVWGAWGSGSPTKITQLNGPPKASNNRDDYWAIPPTPGQPFSGVPNFPIGGGSQGSGTSTPQTYTPPRIPTGWNPSGVMVLPYGCAPQEKPARINDIYSAWDGKRPQTGRGLYLYEPIMFRTVQDQASEPNDPLYDKGEAARKAAAAKVKAKAEPAGGPDLSMAEPPGADGGGHSHLEEFGPSRGGKKGPTAIDQWGLRAVGFTPATQADSPWHGMDFNKPNTIVAVIDSGLDTTHPDGPKFLWTNPNEIPDNGIDDDYDGYVDDVHGWNFLEENADLTDYKGHGTLVAGIIAAKSNNGIGIAGINPGAQIMVLKVTDKNGKANSLNIYRALHYAANHGARVINVSLGDRGVSQLEQLAVNYAVSRGAVVVVAAGNQSGDLSQYGPAALRRVLPVAATKINGTRSAISNAGVNLALAAPGEEIYSLQSKDAEWTGSPMDRERLYRAATGTSFSAPLVAGTASLLLAKNPKLTSRAVEAILLETATDTSGEGWNPQTGAGVLNAAQAVAQANGQPMLLRPTEVVVNREKKSVASVDVFGVVRGAKSYQVELGKGKRPKEWQPVTVADPTPIEYGLLCRLEGSDLATSKDWVVRISASDAQGHTTTAQIPVSTQ